MFASHNQLQKYGVSDVVNFLCSSPGTLAMWSTWLLVPRHTSHGRRAKMQWLLWYIHFYLTLFLLILSITYGSSVAPVIGHYFFLTAAIHATTSLINLWHIHIHLFRMILNALLELFTGHFTLKVLRRAWSNVMLFCSNVASGYFYQWVGK